jgi:hypothetical protein
VCRVGHKNVGSVDLSRQTFPDSSLPSPEVLEFEIWHSDQDTPRLSSIPGLHITFHIPDVQKSGRQMWPNWCPPPVR